MEALGRYPSAEPMTDRNTTSGITATEIKVWLDDERPAPAGWVPVRWPEEAIERLRSNTVTHISLDHDLGDDARGTGYDVIVWIEQEMRRSGFRPPHIAIHSANPAARARMAAGVAAIVRYQAEQRPA